MIIRLIIGMFLCLAISGEPLLFAQDLDSGGGPVKPAQTAVQPEQTAEQKTKANKVAQSDAINLTTQGRRSTKVASIIVFFPSESSDAEIQNETEPGVTTTVQIFSGKRVYGSARLESAADWIKATSIGTRIDLKRPVSVKEIETLVMQISFDDAPMAWDGSKVKVNVVVDDGNAETTLFESSDPDSDLSDFTSDVFVWPFPILKELPQADGTRFKLLHIQPTESSVQKLTGKASEVTLEVVWNNVVIQRYTIKTQLAWSVAVKDGIFLLSPKPIVEEISQQLAIRCFATKDGRPYSNENVDELKLKVVGIATDDLKTTLCPSTNGQFRLDKLNAEMKILNSQIGLVDDLLVKSKLGTTKGTTAGLTKEKSALNKKLKEFEKEIKLIKEDPDERTRGAYWRFQKITPDDPKEGK